MASSSFDDRELCPDGDCIGIIGAHGRCNECGASRRGKNAGDVDEDEADEMEEGEAEMDEGEGWDVDDDDDDNDGENWDKEDGERGAIPRASQGFDDRQLCPDGSCIGLIGNRGCCSTCGATATFVADPSEEE